MVWYLHPAYHHPGRIRKVGRLFGDELYFVDIKFPLKIRDICKIDKKNSLAIIVLGYENKEKYPISVLKNALKKNMVIYC